MAPGEFGSLELWVVEPGDLIASGRDGDIFEFGAGLVLRKTRDGRSIEHEARVMRYAAEYGYPVPAVHDVRAQGSEIVMQRIDGPLMMEPMAKRPWTIPRYASLLADLHDQLHQIPAADWLRQLPDGGDRLVHLDLHPLNVLLSPQGPVATTAHSRCAGSTIDWRLGVWKTSSRSMRRSATGTGTPNTNS
jgi:aminoglycoside phosphotransferase (APT) family kinase protein